MTHNDALQFLRTLITKSEDGIFDGLRTLHRTQPSAFAVIQSAQFELIGRFTSEQHDRLSSAYRRLFNEADATEDDTTRQRRRAARAELDQYIDEIWAEVFRLRDDGVRDASISDIAHAVAAKHKAATDLGPTLDHNQLRRVVKCALTGKDDGDGPLTFRGPDLAS